MTTALTIPVAPVRLVAALVLAAAVVCWPVPALADELPALPGEGVEASGDVGAPTDVSAGTWRFDVGSPGESRWFRLRREITGSTVHAAVLAPAAEGDGLAIAITTPDGDSCGSDSRSALSSGGRLMDVSLLVGPDVDPEADSDADGEAPCLTAKSLLVEVGRSSFAEAAGDLPVTLRLVEEAPVETLDGLPTSEEETEFRAPDVSGEAAGAEAAPGLVDVPEIETGIYRGTVATGKLAVRRISLDWGQHALVRLVSPQVSESVAEDFDDGLPSLRLAVRDPLLRHVDAQGTRLSPYDVTTLDQVVGPVRYLERAQSGDGSHLPGDHFLVIEADDVVGDGLDIDYTLQIEIVGEPDGAPDHTEDDPFVLADGESSRLVAYDADGGLVRLLAAGVLAALGVGSLGAGGVLLRRRGPRPSAGAGRH